MQYEEEGIITTFNLACKKVDDQHTAVNIKRWIREIMDQYEIEDSQILVFSADSAANIQKAAKLFLKDLKGSNFFVTEEDQEENEENDEDDQDDESNGIDTTLQSDGNDVDEWEEEEDSEDMMESTLLPAELLSKLAERIVPKSYRVGCVAHQLQLAVNKWCETKSIAKLLSIARAISTKMRTRKVGRVLEGDGYPRAIIDQQTRWSSKHAMTTRLALLKEFYEDHSADLLKMKGE